MTADKTQVLFDLGIDEEVIRQQPTDYFLIKKWLAERIKNVKEMLCSQKKQNIDQEGRYKTGEEKPKNSFLIKKMFKIQNNN